MMILTNTLSRSRTLSEPTTIVYVATRAPRFMGAMRTSYNASPMAKGVRWIDVCDWFMLTTAEEP